MFRTQPCESVIRETRHPAAVVRLRWRARLWLALGEGVWRLGSLARRFGTALIRLHFRMADRALGLPAGALNSVAETVAIPLDSSPSGAEAYRQAAELIRRQFAEHGKEVSR